MDILLFDSKSAEESIAFAQEKRAGAEARRGWDEALQQFFSRLVSGLRACAADP
jgi:hypothetical protein